MEKIAYTVIPDTSDSAYWEPKIVQNSLRSTTFVPRDKELHQRLRVQAWALIQASLTKKHRKVVTRH